MISENRPVEKIWTRLLKDQTGQTALLLAMALVIGGVLVVAPFLALSMSTYRYTEVVKRDVQGFYAAEAGVEYGLRYLLDNAAPSGTYNPVAPEQINGLQIQISITTVTIDASHTDYTITADAGRDGELVTRVVASGSRTGSSQPYNIAVSSWTTS